MSVLEGDLDKLVEEATEEIRHAKEIKEYPIIAVITHVYKIDR
jgi:hypothetical protein